MYGRIRVELGRARVDPLVDRLDAGVSCGARAPRPRKRSEQMRELAIREAEALRVVAAASVGSAREVEARKDLLGGHELLDLAEEPRVDLRQVGDLVDASSR